MSSMYGINQRARFSSRNPLGIERQGRLSQRFSPGPDFSAPTNGFGHKHRWRWWSPNDRGDLSFFDGSFREMQAIVMKPGAEKSVRRFGREPARYYVENEGVAKPYYGGGRFVITAGAAGQTVLHAENDRGQCQSALFIHVRPVVELPVQFLFLRDGSGKTAKGYWSRRAAIIKQINEIYLPQLAVQLVDISPVTAEKQPVEIEMELGDSINLSLLSSATVHHQILTALPPSAKGPHPKFLFVWKFTDTTVQGLQKHEHLYIRDGISENRLARVCARTRAYVDLAD